MARSDRQSGRRASPTEPKAEHAGETKYSAPHRKTLRSLAQRALKFVERYAPCGIEIPERVQVGIAMLLTQVLDEARAVHSNYTSPGLDTDGEMALEFLSDVLRRKPLDVPKAQHALRLFAGMHEDVNMLSREAEIETGSAGSGDRRDGDGADGEGLTDPIPVVEVVRAVGRNAGRSDKLAEKMRRRNYPVEKRAGKYHCQRADAIAMFARFKQRIQEI